MRKSNFIIAYVGALTIIAGIRAYSLAFATVPSAAGGKEETYLYIDANDNIDSVKAKSNLGWRFDFYQKAMKYKVRTGRYKVENGMTMLSLYRTLRNGHQEAINLTIPNVRTMDRLAGYLGEKLMVDSLSLVAKFQDTDFCEKYGYTTETLPALFIPNTYEVYWNMSVDALMKRMQDENKRFWNNDRCKKAELLNLTHAEIATLASIVDEETANNGEKPMIASMYLNRLRIGMPLQADPTVKFAVGDFSLRRILNVHLLTENPYNTYRNTGLPPGPIRIASIVGIDAVLNHAESNYLYMCAKEDFSGTHNFATTYAEHLKNARRYINALNERNIH